jgi:hypothetical protein
VELYIKAMTGRGFPGDFYFLTPGRGIVKGKRKSKGDSLFLIGSSSRTGVSLLLGDKIFLPISLI